VVFLKPLEKLEFTDIEKLKSNKICESQILDYKKQLLGDNKLLKQVSAFANTQGGFLIFGVEETGKGGYPKENFGINKSQLNKERIEQIILGNIQPRLNVKIQIVEHPDSSKAILVIQIPNSYLKPHMNSRDNKFYKRYEFEALPMTEIEVSSTYKRRFAGYQEVESYISKLEFEEFTTPQIVGQIIVIPTILTHMIDTSDVKEFEWMNNLSFKPKYPYIPTRLTPSANGVRFQYGDKDGHAFERLEIHRNGCTQYTAYFGTIEKEKMIFLDTAFCLKLLHTLQFTSTLYQKYNYFGDVKIICNLRKVEDSWILQPHRLHRYIEYPCQVKEIIISRERPTNMVESKYEFITSRIMDEIFNSYGLWKCPLFDDKGNLKELR